MTKNNLKLELEGARNEFNKACDKVWKGAKKVGKWVVEHPQESLILATGLLTGIGAATRGVAKVGSLVQDASERKDEARRIWNPVSGEYLYTKKPLTGKQKLEFEERLASGEARAAILKSMGVLDMKK